MSSEVSSRVESKKGKKKRGGAGGVGFDDLICKGIRAMSKDEVNPAINEVLMSSISFSFSNIFVFN